MTVTDNIIQAEGLGNFFRNLGEKGFIVLKKMSKEIPKNPPRSLDITANIANAAASRNPKNVSSKLSEVINFYHTGKKLYLGKFM